MDYPPSRAQLRYLKNLKYDGTPPLTKGEASAALDELIAGRGSAAARAAMLEERRLVKEEERREREEEERQNALDDLEIERDLAEDLAAIDREYGTKPAGCGCSPIVWLILAPFRATGATARAGFNVFGSMAAAGFWVLSRLIAGLGWVFAGLAWLLVWILSRVGMKAAQSAAATARTGREKVIPWVGAQDWRMMAAGCRAQAAALVGLVDGLLARASGDDRFFLYILRAIVAGVAIGVPLLYWFL